MTTVEDVGSQVEDRQIEEAVSGLVLPEGVVASLAEQLAARARAGKSVVLTGPGAA